MNLSDLVKYRDLVDKLSLQESGLAIQALMQQFHTDLNSSNIDFANIKGSISQKRQNILTDMNGMYDDLAELKKYLHQALVQLEPPYLTTESESLYAEGLNDDYNYKLDRDRFKKLLYNPATMDFFLARIDGYISWKYAGLQLGPRIGDITEHLVGFDPLYLVDEHEDMFCEVRKMWLPQFQRRLRYYVIDEQRPNILASLPREQFGFVVAVDYFNFRPLRLIKRYLAALTTVLQPGGVAIFTYNNCDYPIGVDNFLNSYYTYTPGRLVKAACTEYGFKILASFDLDNNVSWLEIQKTGITSSIKGGQSLAAIRILGE